MLNRRQSEGRDHAITLGDGYKGNAPQPIEVVEVARDWFEVFSIRDFKNPVRKLQDWYERTGMLALWSDDAR